MLNYLKWFMFIVINVFILIGCGGGEGSLPSEYTLKVNIKKETSIQDEFKQKSIEKKLPNGKTFEINNIVEVSNISTNSNEKVYQTKIDNKGDGFFVIGDNSIEGTFIQDGKVYSIGTFKDGERIEEINTIEDIDVLSYPSLSKERKIDLLYEDRKYKIISSKKANLKILFVYNEDFFSWCNNDKNIVKNKLNALVAYTNTAFTRSNINAEVSIAGSEKITFSKDDIALPDALKEGQSKLINKNDDLYKFREKYNADIVFVLRKQPKYIDNIGGMAYYTVYKYDTTYNKNPNLAIGFEDIVNSIDYTTFSHEIGHILGCKHNKEVQNTQNPYNKYANGYWFNDNDNTKFTSMMGYRRNGRVRIQNYSNPKVNYHSVPTGILGDGYDASDCAKFINFSAPIVSQYRVDKVIKNQPPIVNAGVDIKTSEATKVLLNGVATDSDGYISKYKWIQLSGIPINIIDSNILKASFIAPKVDKDETLEFKLTVTDDKGAISEDFVKVLVTKKAIIINANDDIFEVDCPTSTLNRNVLDNDTGNLKNITLSIIKKPDYIEEFSLSNDGVLHYKSSNNYADRGSVIDSFTYKIIDGLKDSIAKVTIKRNMSIIKCRIPKFMNAFRDKNTEIVSMGGIIQWQDNFDVKSIKKPWITQKNYDTSRYFDTSGDTATNYCKNLNLGGHNNWRLPTKAELLSIINLNDTFGISRIFKNFIESRELADSIFWSSTSYSGDDSYVFYVSFANGKSFASPKYLAQHVRCIRIEQFAHAGADQIVNENTTVRIKAREINFNVSSYEWIQTSGPKVSINKLNAVEVSFKAPSVNANTVLTFKLIEKDFKNHISEDTINITVMDTYNPISLAIIDNMSGVAGASLINKKWVTDKVTFTFKFSKIVTGFDSSDITVTNATKGSFSGNGDTYTLEVIPNSHSTTPITVSVGEGVAQDINNNTNSATSATQEVNTVKAFITTWKTDNNGNTLSNQVKIKTVQGDNYNYKIDWGDNSIDNNVTGDITHTYNNIGTYTIKIYGTFPRILFTISRYFVGNPSISYQPLDDNLKLLSIEQWGTTKWKSMSRAFYYCKNLDGNARDIPDLSNVIDMSFMFKGASNFNQDINDWNVSKIENMLGLFSGAKAFNQPLNNWDVSNVKNMDSMFSGIGAFDTIIFNKPLNNWNTSNVNNMDFMFYGANSFNQNIDNWNVSNVVSMKSMFFKAISFNQPLNNWNVSKVFNMYGMFYGASSFDQNLNNWNVSNVTRISHIFSSLSTSNYDSILNSWSKQSLQPNISFSAYPTKYSNSSSVARQSLINNYNWSINDGGAY